MIDFAARQLHQLYHRWSAFRRTPFEAPSMDLIRVPIDSDAPIFAQIAFTPPDGNFCFEITWHGENDEDKMLFKARLDAQLQMLTLNRAIIDTKFGQWHHNFMTNFCHGSLSAPFVHQLPKRTKTKALIVGNGPSADALGIDTLQGRLINPLTLTLSPNGGEGTYFWEDYEVYACWHGARRVPGAPDYVCHASTVQPADIPLTVIPGAVFVGEPVAAPGFYQVARLGGNPVYIHCDPANPYDNSFAEWRGEPHGTVNPAGVMALVINTAIQCGHDDITLIGVDLTGPGNNEAQRFALEQFPAIFANIRFKNLSTSVLQGFENLNQ